MRMMGRWEWLVVPVVRKPELEPGRDLPHAKRRRLLAARRRSRGAWRSREKNEWQREVENDGRDG